MNERAISKRTHLDHTGLKHHLKVTIEINMHRMAPDKFPPIHFDP